MYDYSNISNTTQNLIDKFGKTVIRKGFINTGTEWNPTQVPNNKDIKAVQTRFKKNEIDGTLIQAKDVLFLTYEEVNTDNKIEDDSVVYNVVNVDLIKPSTSVIIYKVQARR